jgi:outer membrane protein insertion porin family
MPKWLWVRWLGALLWLVPLVTAAESGSFIVRDVRVDGLQRITPGTVFNYLPLKIGDLADAQSVAAATRALAKTGFFKDVRILRDGDLLLIEVEERPSVAKIELSGNQDFPSEDLLKSLKELGLAEGRIFNRALLDKVEQELQKQYLNLGKYAVTITTRTTPLERNRVALNITIDEGEVAKIRSVNFTGNLLFDDKTLRKQFQLGTTAWYEFLSTKDQYSQQKFSADLETLRSFYLDRGYLNFRVDTTQVAISPDKKSIFITVNLSEGEVFTVSEVKLSGDLRVPAEQLFPLIQVRAGETFSRRRVTEAHTKLSDRLANEGYAFANINGVPTLDQDKRTVALNFLVDPGRQVYVRRINFSGNTKTRDEVLRREMRQMEAAPVAADKVNRSRVRLQRLGFFDEVNLESQPVPGSDDQVDLNVSVKEKPSGNFLAGLGFSQNEGLILSSSVTQENFLGSGKQFSVSFNTSSADTLYAFSYQDPYYTEDGVSRGFQFRYRTTDSAESNVSDYLRDTLLFGVNFGIPLNEFDRVSLNLDAQRTELKTTTTSPQEVLDFIAAEGGEFTTLELTAGWSHDTRNKAFFPDRGVFQRLSASVVLPGSDLEFYKLSYKHQLYYPLTRSTTLKLNGELAYGDGYGDTEDLPFFEHFFAGGVRSVRGFEDNSLGPRDSSGDPFGGNARVVGNVELLFPMPFNADQKSVRLGAFFDAGNVYADSISVSDLRYSTGLSAMWLSPFGSLVFSVARALNSQDEDRTQVFQFSFGAPL